MPSSSSKLIKLVFKPGFHRESTEYAEEGKWYNGDKVRFRAGMPENMRGYAKFLAAPLLGTARDLLSWINNDTEKLLSSGTEQRLYLTENDYSYDITPIIQTVSIDAGVSGAGNFNTSVGSSQINVSLTNSGVSVGDWLTFSNASLNGFTLGTNFAVSAFGGPTYRVTSIDGLNSFYFGVSVLASSTVLNSGHAVMGRLLTTQQTNSIQGLGFGASFYNAGVSTTGMRAWNVAASSSGFTFQANQWSLDNWGEDLLAVRRGSQLFYWDADASVTPERATIVSSSPSIIDAIVVSPNDRHVFALGTTEFGTGNYNPLLVRWSDQEDYTNWVPAVSTTSGELVLIDGTEIRGGIRARNAIHVWTDRAAYAFQYVGPPFIFSQTQLGTNCGLVGPHAAVAADGVPYWMSQNNFYRFSGRVERLDCTIRRDVFDNFNLTQSDKVYAGTNSEFNEVIWLIPGSDSEEPSRYVIYNILEDHWVFGDTFYTTFEDSVVFSNTITTGIQTSTSYLFNNEPVSIYTGDGIAVSSFLQSANFDIDEGGEIMFIDRVIPDFFLKNGTISFSVILKQFPNGDTITKGPFIIGSETDKVDFRGRGRQASFSLESTGVNTGWRMGATRMSIQPDGKR